MQIAGSEDSRVKLSGGGLDLQSVSPIRLFCFTYKIFSILSKSYSQLTTQQHVPRVIATVISYTCRCGGVLAAVCNLDAASSCLSPREQRCDARPHC